MELLAAKTRILLKERGQPMLLDVQRKFDAGLLTERDYKLFMSRSKMADKDSEIH